jgi:Zn-dependent peptidase ImmA (M78 family)/transcriptional regulator with XRE-family HTH domain
MTDQWPHSGLLWQARPRDVFWGDRLQVAREFRGLTQKELSEAVAASPALVSLCESGKKNPSRDLVEAFGSVLGFEPDYFYSNIQDVFREEECSFRHRRSTPERMKNKIRAHATLIGLVIARLKTLFRFPEQDIPHIPASLTNAEEIELASEKCRMHWNLGLDGPIMEVGRVLERAGVIIVSQLSDVQKVDAFSRCGPTAVIALNQFIKSTSRWHFDIGHECGHLVMHQGIHTGSVETELAANRFASAFLMPRRSFAREFRSTSSFSWPHIFALKRRWRTSASSIVRRAYELGLLGAVDYRKAYKYMAWKKWPTAGEPEEPSFQAPELLSAALNSLGTKVKLTAEELRKELHFAAETFGEITGFTIALEATGAEPIQFPSTSK